MLRRMSVDMNWMVAGVEVVHNKLNHGPVWKNERVGVLTIDFWEDCLLACTEGSIQGRDLLL